ncbi:MAG TPA: CHAT domain-containing protein [Pirellulales bacterium]|jgi:CHAT domain-containing protein|nr:CHAT domain-containing protein [Pirellulales bacterium]
MIQPRRPIVATALSSLVLISIVGVAPGQPAAAPAKSPEAGGAAAEHARLLKDAQALVARGEYRQAEKMLAAALQGTAIEKRGARPASVDLSLIATFGEVLIASGKYQPAQASLQRAFEACDQAGDLSRPALAQQAAIAILLSKALARTEQSQPAIGVVQKVLDRYRQAKVADSVVQIELLAQLSSFDAAVRPQATDKSLIDEIARLAEQLALDRQRGAAGYDDYARGLLALSDCQAQLGQRAAAVATIERLIRLRADKREILEELSARRRLADLHRQQADDRAEIETLEAALAAADSHTGIPPEFELRLRYERAEIERLLAAALLRSGQTDAAIERLHATQQDFASTLALARRTTVTGPAGVSEGRLLERMADVAGQRFELEARAAGQLQSTIAAHADLVDNYRQTLVADDPRIASLELILGGLYLKAGDRAHAEPLLHQALVYWRQRIPPDRFRLAQSLHLLGETALVTVPAPPADEIEKYLRESHDLCLAHFPTDPLRWRTQLALGRLFVATGRYRQALDSLHDVSAPDAAVPNDVASAALLQLGLLYKQLLRFDEADRFCRAGLELRQRALGQADAELAPFSLALGSLQVARRDAAALDASIARTRALGVATSGNPAWRWEFDHQQAMAHYLHNEQSSDADQRQAARAAWQKMLADEPDLPTALRARTLHYLSRLDYLDWSCELDAWNRDFAASQKGSQALARLTEQLETYQKEQEKFLADFAAYDPSRGADKKLPDREKQYRELVDRRAALETRRLDLRAAHAATLQQEKQRAQAESGVQKIWSAKLADGRRLADEAVDLLDRQGVYPSLQFTAMCNAAQLIEAQSRYAPDARDSGIEQALAKLDAAVALTERQRTNTFGDDVARAEFFAQYHTAFDLLVQFHLDAHARGGGEKHLVQAMVAAEQCRSRAMLDQLRIASLDDPQAAAAEPPQPTPEYLAGLVERWRKSKQPLLYYYVGSARSYLFVLGGSHGAIEPIRLQAGAEAADFSTTATDASARWIDVHVNRLHAALSDPQSAAAIVGDPSLRQRLVASSSVLLPRAARQFLAAQRQLGASHVVVVPHGAISQLPLEALVIDEGEHLYLDDVAAPLAYAPSLAMLDHLGHAPQRLPVPAYSVLSLGNPDYAPPGDSSVDASANPAPVLSPLPESQKECDRIEAAFGKAHVTRLDRDRASEELFRAALAAHRFSFIHLAAHGVLERDDLNPWLALARPRTKNLGSEADPADGRLDLSEIYRLPLAGCELTVLSACNTNLDARQTARLRAAPVGEANKAGGLAAPALDTGFSIANAFLAAGSRRVVGTQWTVSDDATAELISRFFEKLHAQLAAGRPVNYAVLLAEARGQLRRDKPAWNTPFHWAPFVLIGPADASPTP